MTESISYGNGGKVPDRRRSKTRLRRTAGVLILVLAAAAIRVSSRDLPAYRADSSAGLRGVFHIHSEASHDGRVPYQDMIEAGRRLDVDFLVFTEHNRRPDRPQPRDGPVVVSGTELSTAFGHLIQLGLDTVPKKAMRDSTGLLEFLREQGAVAIAAHPESPKRPWTGSDSGLNGFEITNSAVDFRTKAGRRYVGVTGPLAAYVVNRTLALGQLYRRDDAALARWDARPDPSVFGICGTDTHGWISPRLQYRTWQVVLDPWDRPSQDVTPTDIINRLAEGRFICLAGLLEGDAPRFRFTAEGKGRTVPQGSDASIDSVARLLVSAPVFAGSPASIVLFRDGVQVSRTDSEFLAYDVLAPGTYRVEVRARLPRLAWGSFEVPVLYSNRIRLIR
jgi:hypothetical protein